MTVEVNAFRLPKQMTVDKAEEIKGQMISFLHENRLEVKCLGHEVGVVDAAGLQLLLALYKTAAKEGKKFVITNPSPELREMFSCSGADKVFSVEEV